VVVLPFASTALTVKLKVPAADGVPEIKPELDKDVPVGRVPELREYTTASPESSVAVTCTEYACPCGIFVPIVPDETHTGASGPFIARIPCAPYFPLALD
jgi:hypothetical protein